MENLNIYKRKLIGNEVIKVTNNETGKHWYVLNWNQAAQITGRHANTFSSRFFKRDWTLEIIDGAELKWGEICKL